MGKLIIHIRVKDTVKALCGQKDRKGNESVEIIKFSLADFYLIEERFKCKKCLKKTY